MFTSSYMTTKEVAAMLRIAPNLGKGALYRIGA